MEKRINKDWIADMAKAVKEDKAVIAEIAQRINQQSTSRTIEQQVEDLLDDARYTNSVLKSDGCMTMTEMAKDLGMKSAVALSEELEEVGIIYRESGEWMLKSRYCNHGLTSTMTMKVKGHMKHYLVWTEKGRRWLHALVDRGLVQTAPKPRKKEVKHATRKPAAIPTSTKENLRELILNLQDDISCVISLAKDCLKEQTDIERRLLICDIRSIHDTACSRMRNLESECLNILLQ